MNTHRFDPGTLAALRSLDVATTDLDDAQRERAASTLERIMASDPAAAAATHPAPVRRTPRRLVLAGGAAAAAAVAAVPLMTGGGEAYASWSPTPMSLERGDRQAALEACVARQVGQPGSGEPGELRPTGAAEALVVESRGGWVYVVAALADASGAVLEATCLLPEELIDRPAGGDETEWFGSLGQALPGPTPAADEILETASATGSTDEGLFNYIEGRAGAEVAAVSVTTPSGLEVEASLVDGRFAAWWPAGEDDAQNPELTEAPSVEVTLRD